MFHCKAVGCGPCGHSRGGTGMTAESLCLCLGLPSGAGTPGQLTRSPRMLLHKATMACGRGLPLSPWSTFNILVDCTVNDTGGGGVVPCRVDQGSARPLRSSGQPFTKSMGQVLCPGHTAGRGFEGSRSFLLLFLGWIFLYLSALFMPLWPWKRPFSWG